MCHVFGLYSATIVVSVFNWAVALVASFIVIAALRVLRRTITERIENMRKSKVARYEGAFGIMTGFVLYRLQKMLHTGIRYRHGCVSNH